MDFVKSITDNEQLIYLFLFISFLGYLMNNYKVTQAEKMFQNKEKTTLYRITIEILLFVGVTILAVTMTSIDVDENLEQLSHESIYSFYWKLILTYILWIILSLVLVFHEIKLFEKIREKLSPYKKTIKTLILLLSVIFMILSIVTYGTVINFMLFSFKDSFNSASTSLYLIDFYRFDNNLFFLFVLLVLPIYILWRILINIFVKADKKFLRNKVRVKIYLKNGEVFEGYFVYNTTLKNKIVIGKSENPKYSDEEILIEESNVNYIELKR